ncbi:MAG: hypothetical protein F6K19_36340, partial [Cyanothece sp. SIO1E1]|nr:hypothetical protein [Cyanothece sp. SIO1E1]
LTEKRPDAHCLLAQILEQLDDADVAKPEWETCLRYVSRPEDDAWGGMAKEALIEKETNHAPKKEPSIE